MFNCIKTCSFHFHYYPVGFLKHSPLSYLRVFSSAVSFPKNLFLQLLKQLVPSHPSGLHNALLSSFQVHGKMNILSSLKPGLTSWVAFKGHFENRSVPISLLSVSATREPSAEMGCPSPRVPWVTRMLKALRQLILDTWLYEYLKKFMEVGSKR